MRGTHSIDLPPRTCHAYVVLCNNDSDESQLLVCTFLFCAVSVSPTLCFNRLHLPLTSLLQTHSRTDMHTHCLARSHQTVAVQPQARCSRTYLRFLLCIFDTPLLSVHRLGH